MQQKTRKTLDTIRGLMRKSGYETIYTNLYRANGGVTRTVKAYGRPKGVFMRKLRSTLKQAGVSADNYDIATRSSDDFKKGPGGPSITVYLMNLRERA